MNSLRGRARAELFASLFEALSGWNGTDGSAFSGAHIGKSFQQSKFGILQNTSIFNLDYLISITLVIFFLKKTENY